jgi:hypothetical protein
MKKLVKDVKESQKRVNTLLFKLLTTVRDINAQRERDIKIRKLWETKCFTQRQLARVFSCSQSNIARIISEGDK